MTTELSHNNMAPAISSALSKGDDDVEKIEIEHNEHVEGAALGQALTGFEHLSALQTMKSFKLAALVCMLATFSASADGYQIGMNGNIIANPGFVRQFGTGIDAAGTPYIRASILSGWSNIQSVGQIIGMTGMSFFAARFGRRYAMFAYWFALAISVILETVAHRWEVWLIAKLFAGIGVGGMQMVLPTYVAEVAPTRVRGGLLMLYNFWFSVGNFFAPVALQIMSKQNPENYKVPIYTQWGHIGLMFIIYVFMPESPVWQLSVGKDEAAEKSLARLNGGAPGYDVKFQLELMRQAIAYDKEVATNQKREKWYSIFRGVDGFRTFVSCLPLVCQHFLGLSLFYGYTSYFFQQAGFNDPFAITCITNGVQIAIILGVTAVVDTLGRRNIACSGLTIMWLSNLGVGILGVIANNKARNNILVFFACLWSVGLQFSGSVGWGFIGEISSQRLRPYTAGFAAASTCAIGLILGTLVAYMLNVNEWNWGLKTSWWYFGIGAPFFLMAWFFVPETARRTTAELDELFEAKVKPWRFHKTETAVQRQLRAQDASE